MKEDLAVFKACSDGTRLRILFLLSERELCVCELVAVLEMPQGKISRHLTVLKHSGLVKDRRDGTWIYYALSEPDTGLKQLLAVHFSEEREGQMIALEDRNRLTKLADRGEICIPRPSAALSRTSVSHA